jgi:hypothetical protein
MIRLFFTGSANNTCKKSAKRRLPRSGALALVLVAGTTLMAMTTSAMAQIPQNNGSSQQENRTSSMGLSPDPSASAVHESNKPQSKDAAAQVRGATAGKGHKAEGAGGFNNGLYGTGAGSNK